jgi:hypothetical protein
MSEPRTCDHFHIDETGGHEHHCNRPLHHGAQHGCACGVRWHRRYPDVGTVRFDVLALDSSGEWEQVDDASYCTQTPTHTDPVTRRPAHQEGL